MQDSNRSAILLVVAGAVGGLISIGSLTQSQPMDGPPEQLAVGLTFILSGGFLVLGLLRFRNHQVGSEGGDSIPAVLLLAVGIATAVGSVLLFEPWRSDMTQGFRTFLAGGWALVGIALGLTGEWWRRKQESRYPMAVLSTGFLLSLFYVLFEAFDSIIPHLSTPALLLLVVAAGIPGAWILYRTSPEPEIR